MPINLRTADHLGSADALARSARGSRSSARKLVVASGPLLWRSLRSELEHLGW